MKLRRVSGPAQGLDFMPGVAGEYSKGKCDVPLHQRLLLCSELIAHVNVFVWDGLVCIR